MHLVFLTCTLFGVCVCMCMQVMWHCSVCTCMPLYPVCMSLETLVGLWANCSIILPGLDLSLLLIILELGQGEFLRFLLTCRTGATGTHGHAHLFYM